MRADSALYAVLITAAVFLAGFVVGLLLNNPVIGGGAGALAAGLLVYFLPDPAERTAAARADAADARAEELQRQVDDFNRPKRVIEDARRLRQMERFGKLYGDR